jgi:release factor glutamine methyltransferase
MYEIGYDQAEDVSRIMQEHGFGDIDVVKDLSGLDRVVRGRLI